MCRLRALFHGHRRLTLVLVALALAIKALVPAGFMLGTTGDRFLTVTICADATGTLQTMKLALPADADHGGMQNDQADQAKHCAFSGLGQGVIAAADPVLLAGALLFILLIGTAPLVPLAPRQFPYLRPQLRGPPATI